MDQRICISRSPPPSCWHCPLSELAMARKTIYKSQGVFFPRKAWIITVTAVFYARTFGRLIFYLSFGVWRKISLYNMFLYRNATSWGVLILSMLLLISLALFTILGTKPLEKRKEKENIFHKCFFQIYVLSAVLAGTGNKGTLFYACDCKSFHSLVCLFV